ncbi:MAG: hypothetical protein ACW99A_15750, partial [Candidatus Kariarchaeaceae archaeon]
MGVNKEIIDWKNSTKLKDGTAMASTNLSIFKIISIGLFGLFFGLFETFTNLVYILTNNYRWSRLQHGKEIPIQAEDKVIKRKVVQMFLLGIMLLSITYISLLISPQLFVVGSVLIFLRINTDFF